ncbi:glycosyltransferase 61 family protein [uncultured Jannaschia sp.]|uniref:glycosyltransferase 61 family protein n=1 Tax=uncultured Jannaschia sp. TaxID=293347 RepID=UPI00261DD29F|nr:glycosyltransferase 61 family protein [uncultured Jannaschia sp.]
MLHDLERFALMYRFRPVASQIAKRTGFGTPELAEAAVEVIEEHPSNTAFSKPVLMLDEDRAKVERAQAATSLATQWAIIDGREVTHQATVRYVFKNVLATPFGFFTKHEGFARFGPVRYAEVMSTPIERRPAGFFAASPIVQQYFGHWVRDGMIGAYLRRPHEDLYFPSDPAWTHAKEYVDLLAIDRLQARYVIFDEMSYCRDVGQNAGRAARLERLQAKVQGLFGDAGVPGAFIRRGRTGVARLLLNEDEVVDALSARGFAIVSSTDPLEHILRAVSGTPVTVAMEGSHWNHLFLAARRDALHVTINPADRFNNIFADFIDHTPGQLATTVAVCEGDGYRVDVANLLRLIDLHAERQGTRRS